MIGKELETEVTVAKEANVTKLISILVSTSRNNRSKNCETYHKNDKKEIIGCLNELKREHTLANNSSDRHEDFLYFEFVLSFLNIFQDDPKQIEGFLNDFKSDDKKLCIILSCLSPHQLESWMKYTLSLQNGFQNFISCLQKFSLFYSTTKSSKEHRDSISSSQKRHPNLEPIHFLKCFIDYIPEYLLYHKNGVSFEHIELILDLIIMVPSSCLHAESVNAEQGSLTKIILLSYLLTSLNDNLFAQSMAFVQDYSDLLLIDSIKDKLFNILFITNDTHSSGLNNSKLFELLYNGIVSSLYPLETLKSYFEQMQMQKMNLRNQLTSSCFSFEDSFMVLLCQDERVNMGHELFHLKQEIIKGNIFDGSLLDRMIGLSKVDMNANSKQFTLNLDEVVVERATKNNYSIHPPLLFKDFHRFWYFAQQSNLIEFDSLKGEDYVLYDINQLNALTMFDILDTLVVHKSTCLSYNVPTDLCPVCEVGWYLLFCKLNSTLFFQEHLWSLFDWRSIQVSSVDKIHFFDLFITSSPPISVYSFKAKLLQKLFQLLFLNDQQQNSYVPTTLQISSLFPTIEKQQAIKIQTLEWFILEVSPKLFDYRDFKVRWSTTDKESSQHYDASDYPFQRFTLLILENIVNQQPPQNGNSTINFVGLSSMKDVTDYRLLEAYLRITLYHCLFSLNVSSLIINIANSLEIEDWMVAQLNNMPEHILVDILTNFGSLLDNCVASDETRMINGLLHLLGSMCYQIKPLKCLLRTEIPRIILIRIDLSDHRLKQATDIRVNATIVLQIIFQIASNSATEELKNQLLILFKHLSIPRTLIVYGLSLIPLQNNAITPQLYMAYENCVQCLADACLIHPECISMILSVRLSKPKSVCALPFVLGQLLTHSQIRSRQAGDAALLIDTMRLISSCLPNEEFKNELSASQVLEHLISTLVNLPLSALCHHGFGLVQLNSLLVGLTKPEHQSFLQGLNMSMGWHNSRKRVLGYLKSVDQHKLDLLSLEETKPLKGQMSKLNWILNNTAIWNIDSNR